MIDHIGIGAKDFEASRQFYDATLAILGISQIIEVTPDQTGGYHGIGYGRDDKPFFWLGNGGPRGTGMHAMGRLYTILTGSMSKPFVTHPNDKPSATMIMGLANTYQLPSGGWPIQAWPA
jgi:catechol 2,3-dioxygenase-like lactoylglutathione lyase family enzyme